MMRKLSLKALDSASEASLFLFVLVAWMGLLGAVPLVIENRHTGETIRFPGWLNLLL